MRFWLFFIFLSFSLFFTQLAWATNFTSNNFGVRDPVVSEGGGYGTSTTFQLWGAVAQPVIGSSSVSDFTVNAGFFYFGGSFSNPSPPPPSPSPSPSPPSGGGGIIVTPLPSPEIVASSTDGIPPLLPCGRSDFNCDGEVNLRDLSILFARPPKLVLKTLSVLFTDWTEQLPLFGGQSIATTPAPAPSPSPTLPILNPTKPPFADVGSAFATSSSPEEGNRPNIFFRFVNTVMQTIKGIFLWIGGLF